MYSICLLLLIVLLINNINTINIRCNEDINGFPQIIENCRACIIYIDSQSNRTRSARKQIIDNQPSIEDLFLYGERKYYHRSRRSYSHIILHKKCAREYEGPLYGYNQTHCYCNSNQCNSNIQRCIYEIVSKRYFSCYHGTNISHNTLEINKYCRSCRLKINSNLFYEYQCLTFGEQEQNNDTHCTCQHPMCNQDYSVCQRFQPIKRVNFNHELIITTISSTTILNSTDILNINQTEQDSITFIQTTSSSYNETDKIETMIIERKNQANYISRNFLYFYLLNVIISLFVFC